MAEQTIKDLKKEIYLVMHKTEEMLELTEDGFMRSKLALLDEADELTKEIQTKEDSLTAMLAKIASQNSEARALLSVPSHIEKIATSIKRITESSRIRLKEGLLFSDKAIAEAGKLFAKAKEVLKKASDAAVTGSQGTIESVLKECDAMDGMASSFATVHEERLVTGECSPKTSSTYLSILYAFDDIAEHLKESVKRLSGK